MGHATAVPLALWRDKLLQDSGPTGHSGILQKGPKGLHKSRKIQTLQAGRRMAGRSSEKKIPGEGWPFEFEIEQCRVECDGGFVLLGTRGGGHPVLQIAGKRRIIKWFQHSETGGV